MLSDLTPEEFEYCRAALALAQALGLEKPPGEISAIALAEWFCTNPSDMKNETEAALEKLRNLLHV
jgi:hypothetical protein